MNIILASDDRGSDMMAVTVYSIVKNNPKISLSFFIIQGDISDQNKKRIRRIEKKYSKVSIQFIPIDKEFFEGIDVTNKGVTMPAYYRYLAPEALPKSESRALYVDFDMLCLGDIGELYETKLNGAYLGAVADYVVENNPAFNRFKSGIGFADDETYVNSGLLLMDLQAMRSSGIMEKFWYNARNKNEIIPAEFNLFADQTVANITFKGKVKLLKARYNVYTTVLEEKRQKNPLFVHFTGPYKPLTYRNRHTEPYDEAYYTYYRECMEIIGSNDNLLMKSTLKRLSREAGDSLKKLQDSEKTRFDQHRQLEEFTIRIGELDKSVAVLTAQVAEEKRFKGALKNIVRSIDRKIVSKRTTSSVGPIEAMLRFIKGLITRASALLAPRNR